MTPAICGPFDHSTQPSPSSLSQMGTEQCRSLGSRQREAWPEEYDEFDSWSVSSFRMDSTFTSDHLRVELILIKDTGRSTLPAHLSDLLLEKSVVICFTVQHAQMAELYDFIREV